MPFSNVRNHSHPLYNYVAKIFVYPYPLAKTGCGSTPISTLLGKLARFFIIDIFLINKNFPSCKASSKVNRTGQYLETQEKGLYFLGCQNLKNFQGESAPRAPRSLRLRRSFRNTVSIYPRSAPGNGVS